jgi:hypothetical protein
MKKLPTLHIVLIFLLCGCEGDTPFGPPSSITSYPLQIGNRWSYNRTMTTFNVRLFDSTMTIPTDTVTGFATVEVTGTLRLPDYHSPASGDSIETTVTMTSMFDDRLIVFHNYYAQEGSALRMHGYTGGPFVAPRTLPGVTFHVDGIPFQSLTELEMSLTSMLNYAQSDSIILDDPPREVLQFPLMPGRQWVYWSSDSWHTEKRVDRQTWGEIGGAARSYTEVRWLYDRDRDGEWDENLSVVDRLSIDGLLQRTFEIRDIVVTGPGGPDPIGLMDFRDDWVITEIRPLQGGSDGLP